MRANTETIMKITLERIGNEFYMEAKGKAGIAIPMDHSQASPVRGSSPMEVLLSAVAGCSAIDIISILQKQRIEINKYRAEVEGVREKLESATPFKSMKVSVYLEGDIPKEKAKRAASLSFEKYCSVSLTLNNVALDWEVFVNDERVA